MVRLGDRRGLDRLIRGLEDPDPRLRAKCIDVLSHTVGQDFGYRPDARPDERAAAVARWRAWAAQVGTLPS